MPNDTTTPRNVISRHRRGGRSPKGRITRGLLGTLGLIALLATTGCNPPAYSTSVVASGLNHPWDIAFAGNAMLVTERVGPVSAFIWGVKRVIVNPSDVVARSEGGMMGLAVDPGFGSNRRIYTCFMSNAGGALDVRVVRWSVNDSFDGVTSRTDILTGIPVSTSNPGQHSGCRLRFGPDGALWVTTGDAIRGDTSQNPNSLGGKVLRITADGAGAPGNPGGALRPEIYTLGHRNPQGVAFRPSDGRVFEVEHGTGCNDEINLLTAGGNYGWNPGAGGGYDSNAPMTDTRIAGAIGPIWASGCPTIAPSGGDFISGAQWGNWNDTLAMAVLKARRLEVVSISPDGTGTGVHWVEVTDRGRLRVAVLGPDGRIYIATDADSGNILALTAS